MATETLRPNAAGDETGLDISGTSPAATNWESVDDVGADESVTAVIRTTMSYARDLYNLPASGVGGGVINKITVYVRCRVSEPI